MINSRAERKQREDKKAFKSFVIVLAVSAVIGAVIGVIMAGGADIVISQILRDLQYKIAAVSPYLLFGLNVVMLILIICCSRGAEKMLRVWDGENEQQSDEIDKKLSIGLLLNSVDMILSFFLFGASILENSASEEFGKVVMNVGGLIFCLIVVMKGQKRLIDLTKMLNPEKKGSVYDLKFQKVWLESCDEAEKQMSYQSAYKAYSRMQVCYPFIWLFCIIGISSWGFDLVPLFLVTVMWMIEVISYTLEAMRLSKPVR